MSKVANTQIHKYKEYTNTASIPIDTTYVIFLKCTWYEELEDNMYRYCINAAIVLENICKLKWYNSNHICYQQFGKYNSVE